MSGLHRALRRGAIAAAIACFVATDEASAAHALDDAAGTMNGQSVTLGEIDEALQGSLRKRWAEMDRIIRDAAWAICERRAIERLARDDGKDVKAWRAALWQRASAPAQVVDHVMAEGARASKAPSPPRSAVEYSVRVRDYRRLVSEAAKREVGDSFSLLVPPAATPIDREPPLPSVVAKCLGGEITGGEVERFAAFPLFRRRAEVATTVCRQFEIDYSNPVLLRRMATAKGMSVPDLMKSLEGEVAEPPAEEVERIARARYKNADPASQAKVKLALEAKERVDARMEVVEKLRRETTATCTLAFPEPPNVETEAASSAPGHLGIAYFGSFRCKHCAKSWEMIDELRQGWDKRVTITFRHHFPDAMQPLFQDAIEAECSKRQGKLDAYAAFRLSRTDAKVDAQALGLDAAAFHACLDDPATAVAVLDDAEEAQRLGFREAIPSWVIGRRPRRGFQGKTVLDATIEAQLQLASPAEPSRTAAPAPDGRSPSGEESQ